MAHLASLFSLLSSSTDAPSRSSPDLPAPPNVRPRRPRLSPRSTHRQPGTAREHDLYLSDLELFADACRRHRPALPHRSHSFASHRLRSMCASGALLGATRAGLILSLSLNPSSCASAPTRGSHRDLLVREHAEPVRRVAVQLDSQTCQHIYHWRFLVVRPDSYSPRRSTDLPILALLRPLQATVSRQPLSLHHHRPISVSHWRTYPVRRRPLHLAQATATR